MDLLLLDSRNRANSGDDASTCRFVLTPAITNIHTVSLCSFDLPIPAIEDDEGVFLFTIDEFGTNVRGTNEADNCTFVLLRETAPETRTALYSKITFDQIIMLPNRNINQLNCRISYRQGSGEPVVLGGDWSCLLKIN